MSAGQNTSRGTACQRVACTDALAMLLGAIAIDTMPPCRLPHATPGPLQSNTATNMDKEQCASFALADKRCSDGCNRITVGWGRGKECHCGCQVGPLSRAHVQNTPCGVVHVCALRACEPRAVVRNLIHCGVHLATPARRQQ